MQHTCISRSWHVTELEPDFIYIPYFLHRTKKGCITVIHDLVCLVRSPQPLPKQVLYRMCSSAPSLKFQYLAFSLQSSSRCLCLLPCLHIPPILASKMCFRQQYLRKMWQIQLAFLCITVSRMFLSSHCF